MTSAALRVLVVQHAEKERLPGDPGLTPLGRHQAEVTARWLAAEAPEATLWSSPMRRAAETAAALAAALDVDVRVDDRLTERMNWSGSDGSFEEFLAEWERTAADRSYRPRTGDSSDDAADRFLRALAELAEAHPAETAIVVAHGGVTVDLLRSLLGDAELIARAPTVIPAGIPSCAITTLRATDEGWAVDEIASCAHLP